MALSELSERCYRTIGHYLSTIGVHYQTIGPGLSLLVEAADVGNLRLQLVDALNRKLASLGYLPDT